MTKENVSIIGSNAYVDLVGVVEHVPAKIDTGADGSALWASEISVDEAGVLHYKLFDKSSSLYTGIEHTTKEFSVVSVMSSNGQRELRYKVKLSVIIAGRHIRTLFSLSNRSVHNFPVLIGRRTLKNRFLVDVSQREIQITPNPEQRELNEEMQQNPHAFHKKYHAKKMTKENAS